MLSSLENNSKHENKLRNIVQLNKVGSTIYTDATSEALTLGCSKSEFIAALKKDIDKTAYDLIESYGIIKSVKNGIVTDIANPETVNSFLILAIFNLKIQLNLQVLNSFLENLSLKS